MLKDAVRTDASGRDRAQRRVFKASLCWMLWHGDPLMFAARAGAKRVVGVDMSSMAFKAMEMKENGLEDVDHCAWKD